MKKLVFSWIQPVTLLVIVLFWVFAPKSLVDNSWTIVVASALTTAFIQALEFVNERHVGWRLDRREFFTDLFYVVLYSSVIAKLVTKLDDEPLESAKHALGITTGTLHLPFIAQVAFVVFLIEFGQYWMHRAMHNSFLWWTHAPHHHITQLNAMKGAVGNPIELFLVSLSVVALRSKLRQAASISAARLSATVCCALRAASSSASSAVRRNVSSALPSWPSSSG